MLCTAYLTGNWWDDIPKSDWPSEEAAVREIIADFSGSHGDRRQEVVFIGKFKQSPEAQTELITALDSCLLNDAEFKEYEGILSKGGGDEALKNRFLGHESDDGEAQR